MYKYIFICLYVCMYVKLHTHICIAIYLHICIATYIHAYICIAINIYVSYKHIYVYVYSCMDFRMYTSGNAQKRLRWRGRPASNSQLSPSPLPVVSFQFKNNCFTEMCSGSEQGL